MLQGCINESETGPVTNVRISKTCFLHSQCYKTDFGIHSYIWNTWQSMSNGLSFVCKWTESDSDSAPPDRTLLRVAGSAGCTRREEGVRRLPRGPQPRGRASDAWKLLQWDGRSPDGGRRSGEWPVLSGWEEARGLLPQLGPGALAVPPQTGTGASLLTAHLQMQNSHRTIHLTCLLNAPRVGHLLSHQPPHRHSDGGKSGKSADGEYCLWGRTVYQEYGLQQG